MTLMGKDLLRYSNKTKSNDPRQCRYDYYPQDGGENQILDEITSL